MSLLVVGGPPWSSAQKGVENDEVALNISSHECHWFLAVDDTLPSNVGEPRAFIFSDNWSREITQEGEIVGAIPYGIATACELANDIETIGDGAGDVFFYDFVEKQSRDGWRMGTLKFKSHPGITIV